MTLVLLVVHIGAAIVFIGPTTFASSAFARFAKPGSRQVAAALHAITRSYGTASLIVPAAGLMLAAQRGYLGQSWLLASIALFALALGLLFGVALPAQAHSLTILQTEQAIPAQLLLRLRLGAGFFALAWLAVLVLMVLKPF